MEGEIRVKVIPDTTVLDKELKKKRTFTGLLGFGGGDGGDKESAKKSEKTNSILGKILGSLGVIAIVSSLLGGLFRLLKPFVDLFSVISFLVWIPLWKALKPVLKGLAKFTEKLAKEGGGLGGAIRAGAETVDESLKGESIFKRIGVALLTAVLAVISIVLIGAATAIGAIPALIIAAVIAVVTLIILAWDPLVALFNTIVQAWKDFFRDVGIAWNATVEFFKKLGKRIGEFGTDLWNFFVDGFKIVLDFGDRIWNLFLDGLSFLSNLGQMIWDVIKSGLSGIGGGIRSFGSFINPFDDFIQRPGQSPTAFSPNDTIIGVKDPSRVFGGGGSVTQNISINATINNDMDIRRMAERLAELSKEELAMSTGSQRF